MNTKKDFRMKTRTRLMEGKTNQENEIDYLTPTQLELDLRRTQVTNYENEKTRKTKKRRKTKLMKHIGI